MKGVRVSPPPEPAAWPDAAEYLAEMADELAATGERAGLPFLAYLFSMAGAEARTIAGQRPHRPAVNFPARAAAAATAAPLA